MRSSDRFSFRKWSKEMSVAIIFCIVMLLFLNIRRDVMISKSIHLQLKQRHRFDITKIATASNYAVCSKLTALQEDLAVEELNSDEFSTFYKGLVENGQISCGIERFYDGVFGFLRIGHVVERPWQDCSSKITKGKRNVLDQLISLCEMQQLANGRYRALAGANASVAPLPTDHIGHQWQEIFKVSAKTSQGIIYTGSYGHLKQIFQSILALRLLKTSLPIEIWVSKNDISYCTSMLQVPTSIPDIDLTLNTICKQLPDVVGVYSNKFYAMLSTSLTDVIFLDADNVPLRNIEEIFRSAEYKATGAILWPDRCGARCHGIIDDNGYTAFQHHVAFVANVGGLIYNPKSRYYAQEAETGQLAINLQRHGAIVELGRKLIEDVEFFSRTMRGDKDIWRLAFLMAGQEFYFVDKPIGISYSLQHKQRDCLAQYFGNDDINPMFCHQAKVRDKDSLTTILRVPNEHRQDESLCISLRALHDNAKIAPDNFQTTETKKQLRELERTYNYSEVITTPMKGKMKTVLLNSGVVLIPESKLKSRVVNVTRANNITVSRTLLSNQTVIEKKPFFKAENDSRTTVHQVGAAKTTTVNKNSTAKTNLRNPGNRKVAEFSFRVHPKLSQKDAKRKSSARLAAMKQSLTDNQKYQFSSTLILERPPSSLQMGEFLAQVFSVTDEAWFSVPEKSELVLLWETLNAKFALLFRSVFSV